MNNTGSAILLIGVLYFGYTYGFSWYLYVFAILAFLTWSVPSRKVTEEYYKAKTEYYKRKL